MRTNKSSEFHSSLQQYVFITPDVDINPVTNLPYNEDDYCVLTIDEVVISGTPLTEDEEDMELWAIIEPGEEIQK